LHGQTLEEEEEEEDPEWVEFDPKKAVGSFFGRSIQDEAVLREKVQVDKENQIKAWKQGYRGPNVRRPSGQDEDEFDKLVREQKEEALKNAGILDDQDLAAKVADIAIDLEQNERNYSDIDLIYEKNAKKRAVAKEVKKSAT
jgi:hypothetical protein